VAIRLTAAPLLRGEDPMLVKIDADEPICVRERCCNPLDLGADAAGACTRRRERSEDPSRTTGYAS